MERRFTIERDGKEIELIELTDPENDMILIGTQEMFDDLIKSDEEYINQGELK